jgi:hypothetical protein
MKKRTNEQDLLYALLAGTAAYVLFSNFTSGGGSGGQGSSNQNANVPGSGTGLSTSTVTPTQLTTPLSSASVNTIKEMQTQINSLFDYFRNFGGLTSMWWSNSASLPNNLVKDGILGSNTTNAIKHLYAWGYNLNSPNLPKKSPAQISLNIGQLNYGNIQTIITSILSHYS